MMEELTKYTYGNKTLFGFVSAVYKMSWIESYTKLIYASTNFFCIDGVLKVDNPN